MRNDRFLSLMGFAQKSGNLVTGEDTCKINIKRGSVHLVVMAQDASNNTKDRFKSLCEAKKIPWRITQSGEKLSDSVGKINRKVFAITESKFAKEIIKILDATGT